MPLGQLPRDDLRPDARRELQEPEAVGDRRAVLAEPLRQRLLRVAVRLDEALERLGELDGVQSSRWTFSMSASSNALVGETSFTTTIASRRPAFCTPASAARRR